MQRGPEVKNRGTVVITKRNPKMESTEETIQEHITVAVRIRPLLPRESPNSDVFDCISSNTIRDIGSERMFVYDRVFGSVATTILIYEELCERILVNCMNGFNGCIFAYGQTGSGKTYTMHGNRNLYPGVVPLAIKSVFNYILSNKHREFLLKCSYLEIYNEHVNDLLNQNRTNLQLKEDKKGGTKVIGITEEVCNSSEHLLSLLLMGESHKQFASTNFNLRSSRSHTMQDQIRFQLNIETKERGTSRNLTSATINLIDLAGSESASVHMEADSNFRRNEMKYINRSLLTLANVIMRLSHHKGKRHVHIPYRESKLTRILKPSLEGKSKVIIICNISPSSDVYDETISTLKFAQRAKKIKQVVAKNEVEDKTLLLLQYETDIESLKIRIHEKEIMIAEEISQVENIRMGRIEDLEERVLSLKDNKEMLNAKIEALFLEKFQLIQEIEELQSKILVSEGVELRNSQEFENGTDEIQNKSHTDSFDSAEQGSSQINRHHSLPANFKLPIEPIVTTQRRSLNPLDEIISPKHSPAKINSPPKIGNHILPAGPLPFVAVLNENNETNYEELFRLLNQQNELMIYLQTELNHKVEEEEVLRDELNLCRNNLMRIMKQVKDYRKNAQLQVPCKSSL